MAAPRRTEDHQETDQSSRSDSTSTPGTSTPEVKKARKDSGVAGLFEGHEALPTSGKLGTNQSKDSREESRKNSPSSPKVSAESTQPRSTPNHQKITSNFNRNTPTPLPTTQINQLQPNLNQSTANMNPVRKYVPLSPKSEPRTVPPVSHTLSSSSPSFEEDSGEDGGNYVY